MRFILVLRSTFELQQEPMRFILVLRITFELQQEPMRFILVLHITFELQQEPMRFILVLRSTFELQQEPMRLMRFILVLRGTFELQQELSHDESGKKHKLHQKTDMQTVIYDSRLTSFQLLLHPYVFVKKVSLGRLKEGFWVNYPFPVDLTSGTLTHTHTHTHSHLADAGSDVARLLSAVLRRRVRVLRLFPAVINHPIGDVDAGGAAHHSRARRSSRTALIGRILSQIIKTIGSIRSIDDQIETLLMLLLTPLRVTRARYSSSSASAHELLLFSGGFQAPARFTRRFRPFVRRVRAFILLRQAANTPDGSARPLSQPQSLGTSRRVDFAPHQQAEICRGTRDPAFMTSNGPLDETPERRVNADLAEPDLNSSCQSRAYDSASDGRKKGTRGCQKTERKAFARREFHDEE
ncbi:hypothetical protein DPX16_1366 [Anabarilius grahami]|uniref:Uncharacterized protein n=1 Tax=Anabarilius grahami TaxID=495550 RepID=A0A3N0Y848_ANAGA|nr:hypothetical protein DPX16_1366 [Anabarilius grahami]